MDVQRFSLISCIPLLLAAAAAFVWAWGMVTSRRSGRLPPGPRGLPIIGHLHMLGSLPHRTLAQLSQSYGPLMSLRLGSVPLLVASSADMAKHVLHAHDKIFSGRPQNITVCQNAFHALDILFSQPNHYWKLMRQLCVTEFFSAKRVEYFRYMRQEEVQGLILAAFAAQGTPICIREKLFTTIGNVISRMTLGARLQELGSGSMNGLPTVQALFNLMGFINVSDYIPWLAWMDIQGLDRRSREAARTSNAMFQEVIDRRRSSRSADGPPQDFLDVLLSASLDAKNGVKDEHVRAVMMDMFVGGIETSGITIENALAELLVNPEKLRKVEREMEQVVGSSRLLQEADLPNLPYLLAVVHESLRLHPLSPLLQARLLLEPCQIAKYHIPKHTRVHVNTWAIHRDPTLWESPSDFCPERFLDSNVDALTQQCKFLPFGAGRRICPASKLGLITVQFLLGSLIQAFDWEVLSKPLLDEKFGLITTLRDPLVVVPNPKLPNCLFETDRT